MLSLKNGIATMWIRCFATCFHRVHAAPPDKKLNQGPFLKSTPAGKGETSKDKIPKPFPYEIHIQVIKKTPNVKICGSSGGSEFFGDTFRGPSS